MTFKNKLFFQIIVLLSLFLFFPQHRQIFAATTITTCEELQAIPDGSTGDYLIGNDINCSSITNFTPIPNFAGTLDGQNHTISNLTIGSTSSNVGLFGPHGENISISNLSITNADVTGGIGTGCVVGGHTFGSYDSGNLVIENVHCSGTITGTSINTGGLVGSAQRVAISNSSFSGAIISTGMTAGGLVGSAVHSLTITNSNFNGTITTGSGMNTGGLVGSTQCWLSSCTMSISDSSSSGSITSTGSNVGGIIGGTLNPVTIENCHSDMLLNCGGDGESSGSSNVGGLVGYSTSVVINQCYSNSSSIVGDSNTGGLVGMSFGTTIDKSYSDISSITGSSSNIGGLVGFSSDSTIINQSYSKSSSIVGSTSVGGLVGFLGNTSINNCYTTSNVTGHRIGGLIGYATSDSNISQSYSTGELSLVGDEGDVIGGLVAEPFSGVIIINSFSTSKNSSDVYVSLIGVTDPDSLPTITNTYDALTTDIANFSNYSFAVYNDWDFTDIWSNVETYPTFVWQHVSEPTLTPTPTTTQSSNSDTSSINSYGPPVCTDSKPVKTSDLFQINALKNNAKLFFTPTDTNQYYVSFSTNTNAEENGELVALTREGVQSHTIYFLKPNTTYYVKVRSQNGCMPGDWSNIMKFTTNNSVYYKNIKTVSSIVNKIQSKNKITTSVSENVKGVKTEIKKEEIKSESKPKQEVVSNTNKNTNTKRCFLWWCW